MAGAWQLTLPGVAESPGAFPCRPVGLIHTQNSGFKKNKRPTSVVETDDLWAQGCGLDVRC
jgi:hypothetical protein